MVVMPNNEREDATMQPTIMSMEVDDGDFESYYRLRIGTDVKYIVIAPNTWDRSTLSLPLQSLPNLPYGEAWSEAKIWRDATSGEVTFSLSKRILPGVQCPWHPVRINCLEVKRTQQLSGTAFEAVSTSTLPDTPKPPGTFIVKAVRFDWEIPSIERETRAYQLLEGSGLAPRFLGHVHENGRVMGLAVEKLPGRAATIQDLEVCETTLRQLHDLGYLHGDVNGYNFLVMEEGVRLEEHAKSEAMRNEMESLRAKLLDDSGQGGGFVVE